MPSLVPRPRLHEDKGLALFAQNLGLADSALPEIWRRLLILAGHMVRITFLKRTLESCDKRNSIGL